MILALVGTGVASVFLLVVPIVCLALLRRRR